MAEGNDKKRKKKLRQGKREDTGEGWRGEREREDYSR